jgi:hypothetical protein
MVEAELAKCIPICLNSHSKINAGVLSESLIDLERAA